MLFTSSWFVDLILLFVTVAFLVYKYLTRNFDYWKKKGIIYLKPIPFFGNAYDICTFKCNMGPWFKTIYDSVNEPFFGIFILDRPYLVVKSPELIKQMLVNDFNTFSRRVAITPTHNTIVSNMMFFQESVGWRKIRPKMSPTFTSGKLKGMSEIITNIALDMNKYIKNHLGQLDAKEVCAKYSTDVIAGCAFGIRARSFENENADFRKIGKEMFDFSWRNAFCQSLYFLGHPAVNVLRLNFFSSWSVKFVVSAFWDTIKLREESEANGQDLIDVVMSMRKNKKLCQELNFEGDKVAAQAVQFFAAGFETTSTTMAFMLYQLCLHPEIQDRLRQEVIDSIKTNNGITYEGIAKMKYLDMCVLETLRMYPVLPFLDRECNADYKIPGTNVVIDKGSRIYIPMLGLHYDEKYFSKPEEYNPDRFYDKKSYNENGLYYIPFGEGPRICIGERFGMLGSKLGLAYIISHFIIERTPDTPVPVEFQPKAFVLQSKVGLPMKFKEITPQLA